MMRRIASLMLLATAPAGAATIDNAWFRPAPLFALKSPRAFDIGQPYARRFTALFGARLSGTLAQPRFDPSIAGFTRAQGLRIASAGAMFDLFPFRSGFRVSGGARVNGNDARSSSLGGPASPDPSAITAEAGAIHLASIADDFAPVLTLGYTGRVRRGLTVGIEAGALFQGHAGAAAYSPTSGTNPDGNFLAVLERDRLNQQDDFSNYAPSPMAQFNATLRF